MVTRHARVSAGIVAIASALALGGCSTDGVAPSTSPAYETAVLTRGDLSSTLEWDGVLSYDSPFEVVYQAATASTSLAPGKDNTDAAAATEIVTWVAAAGSTLTNGEVIYRVNNVPVVLLQGDAVLWRDLEVGLTGTDVAALESALASLGYDPNGAMTVDSTFRSSTAAAVRRFQAAMDLDETGTFDFRTAVMRPGDVVITDTSLAVGDDVASGDIVLTVSDTSRAVAFSIDPDQLPTIVASTAVQVRLPDGTITPGVVTLVAAGIDADTTTYAVTATLTDSVGVSGDKLDVTVSATIPLVTDALLVPSRAIVVRDDIGASVEVVRDGVVVSVPVTVLATSGQSTAVRSSGLAAGDVVAVP
jgi:peptidoglycan hydrolase-like protein with peptidoglycan-binding domain